MNSVFDYFSRFMVLSDEAKGLIEGTVEMVYIPCRTVIVRQGQVNNSMYIIRKGIARGFRTYNAEELTVSLWAEGEAFGDVTTYITGGPAAKSYQLLEDSELYCLNIGQFRALFAVSHEVCNLGRLIAEEYIVRMEERKREYMALSASERYQYFITKHPQLLRRIKYKYIASYLGITAETFCRIHVARLKSSSGG